MTVSGFHVFITSSLKLLNMKTQDLRWTLMRIFTARGNMSCKSCDTLYTSVPTSGINTANLFPVVTHINSIFSVWRLLLSKNCCFINIIIIILDCSCCIACINRSNLNWPIQVCKSLKPKHLSSFLIRAQVLYKQTSIVDKPIHDDILKVPEIILI